MQGNNSTHKIGIGSISQPDDPDLPGLEFLSYPMKRHGLRRLRRSRTDRPSNSDSETDLYQETYFSDDQKCESFEVDREKTPSEHMHQGLTDYSTISNDDLRTSRPGLWPILG